MATNEREVTTGKGMRVKSDHASLFRRQPGYVSHGYGFFRAEGGSWDNYRYLDKVGIIVHVYPEVVDQATLPEEDRIPSCLEGVPVQIQVTGMPGPAGGIH